ncbi:MAG: hypothetical protein JST36_00735, partial [Bacteroidetes bacterium]|nr:hypothetical protein [Bacteroidota bacterium]
MKILNYFWCMLTILLLSSQVSNAQVTDIKLFMKYDTSICEYAVYLKV